MAHKDVNQAEQTIYAQGHYGFIGEKTFQLGPVSGVPSQLKGIWRGGPSDYPTSNYIALWLKLLPISLGIGVLLTILAPHIHSVGLTFMAGQQGYAKTIVSFIGIALFISLLVAFVADAVSSRLKHSGTQGLTLLVAHGPVASRGSHTSTTRGGVIMPDGLEYATLPQVTLRRESQARAVSELVPAGQYGLIVLPNVQGKEAGQMFAAVRDYCNMDKS